MKNLFFVLLFFLGSTANSSSEVHFEEVCQETKCFPLKNNLDIFKYPEFKFNAKLPVTYKGRFISDRECFNSRNCFLYLGQVADAFKVEVNGKTITDNTETAHNYYSLDSTALAIPSDFLNTQLNQLSVSVKDVNGTIWGLLSRKIFIGYQHDAYVQQLKDWLFRTGFSLFSAYTLIIFALTLLIFLYIQFDLNIVSIIFYCLISSIYLLSFSEIPRKFFDAEAMSGLIHFPLRLSQDLMLFLVFQRMLNPRKLFNKAFATILFLYIAFISIYLFLGLFNVINYDLSKLVIVIGAPLVAMPMGYAFFLASKLQLGFERSLLLPICAVLFLLQLNDLFMFWQIADTYFTVKLYIPFIVATLLFIQLRRYFLDFTNKSLLAEKAIMTKQVAHDINSPLSALNMIGQHITMTDEVRDVYIGAVSRIVNISRNLLEESKAQPNGVISISKTIELIVREKKEEYKLTEVSFSFKGPNRPIYAKGNEIEFVRMMSNIINNAIESYKPNVSPMISIVVSHAKNKIQITVSDTGSGIPKNLLSRIGEYGFSFGKKESVSGSGLGIFSAIKSIERWGGSLQINSEENAGTSVILTLLNVDKHNETSVQSSMRSGNEPTA